MTPERLTLPPGKRWGLLIARVGGVLMILGGAGDLMITDLFPNHLRLLGYLGSEVPEGAERLVLALLHALGAALMASGLAVLLLLREAARGGRRTPAVAAAAIALLAEGANVLGMVRTGSPFFFAPLAFLLLVLLGVGLFLGTHAEVESS